MKRMLPRFTSLAAIVAGLCGCNAILGNEEASLGEIGPGAGASDGAGGQGNGGAGAEGGGGPTCEAPTDCPGAENECQTRACEEGVCGFTYVSDETVIEDDAGNCQKVTCDGAGSMAQADDPLDVPSDTNDCTLDECTLVGPVSTPVDLGDSCDGGDGVCNATGECVECNETADCRDAGTDVCSQGQCVLAGCDDDVLSTDIGETDVDCGGTECPACGDGLDCVLPTDCLSGICDNGSCAAPTCDDGVTNGLETDEDCGGGGDCDPCAYTEGCAVNADCIGNVCNGGVCAASCTDGVQNGQETAIDCGGPGCAAGCDLGATCFAASDCDSGYCYTGASVCDPAHCGDTNKNFDETAPDCGGPSCTKRCGLGQACQVTSDCALGICGLVTHTCLIVL